MGTATCIEPAAPIVIDPDATYTIRQLAVAMGRTVRCLEKWRKNKRMRFPKPFFQGRTPCWRGRVIIAWQDRQQDEAQV